MNKYTVRAVTPLAFAALLAIGACKGNEGRNDSALASDTTLSNLQLANRGDTAQQPQLKDVPATPPATSAPTRTTPKSTTPKSSGTSRSTTTPTTRTTP